MSDPAPAAPSPAPSKEEDKKSEQATPAASPRPTSATSNATKSPEPPKAESAKENKDPKKAETKESAGAAAKPEDGAAKSVTSPEPSENGDGAPGTPKGPSLREQFRAFSKFGDSKSDGKVLTLSQSDKWMKQAKVIDGKTITTTDTGIAFKKFKQMKIGYPDYEKYLQELAKYKKQDVEAIKNKMRNCGTPGTRGTTSVVKGGAVDRLTDTQKYTGSHKQRFDPEGKGKGAAGRKEVADKSGYVAGYKNKSSYDKTH